MAAIFLISNKLVLAVILHFLSFYMCYRRQFFIVWVDLIIVYTLYLVTSFFYAVYNDNNYNSHKGYGSNNNPDN